MFNFENVSAERKSFVGYGINNDVTIVSVESGKSQKETEYIQINVKNTGDDDDNSTILKMYLSEKARPITMRKIMTIHSAVRKIDALKAKSFNTLEDMANGLNDLWSGRRFRLKLQASEYLGEDENGTPKTKIRTEIPISHFAEAVDTGAEMYPIKDENTQLVFDKNDKWDYKRLRGEQPIDESTQDSNSGLPF
jgi:hypothetical protein